MLIVLNGPPGVGKLTVALELAPLLGAKLLDIHSIYNIAFALTEFKSPEFCDTVRAVEAVAYERVRALPAGQPVVLTTAAFEGSDWARQCWDRLLALAEKRDGMAVVLLRCALEENERRIVSEGRGAKRKPRDPEMARRNHERLDLLMKDGADRVLELDTTGLSPKDTARRIAEWFGEVRQPQPEEAR